MLPRAATSRTSGEEPWLAELIRRVANADQGGLSDLYDATSSAVFGLIRRIVDDVSAAEEVTLDVYSQVWRLAPTYSRDKGSPLTWLLMLARSRAIDHLRSHSRRLKDREKSIEVAFDYPHPSPDPESIAISGDRRRVVQAILAELAPEQITLLQLAFFEGLSHGEIAEKTGVPLGTIKSRIRTGMLPMRELLEAKEEIP